MLWISYFSRTKADFKNRHTTNCSGCEYQATLERNVRENFPERSFRQEPIFRNNAMLCHTAMERSDGMAGFYAKQKSNLVAVFGQKHGPTLGLLLPPSEEEFSRCFLCNFPGSRIALP